MTPEHIRKVQGWLTKSNRDLETARKTLADANPFYDIAVYHCQQCAEKAVKGFLLFHNQRFEKTHDISKLLLQAIAIDPGFTAQRQAGQTLTPFATEFRYPDDLNSFEPTQAEFEDALNTASDF